MQLPSKPAGPCVVLGQGACSWEIQGPAAQTEPIGGCSNGEPFLPYNPNKQMCTSNLGALLKQLSALSLQRVLGLQQQREQRPLSFSSALGMEIFHLSTKQSTGCASSLCLPAQASTSPKGKGHAPSLPLRDQNQQVSLHSLTRQHR